MSTARRQPNPVPKLSYSVSEAQRATGAGRVAILSAIARGELSARGIGPKGAGRKFLIAAPSLEAWVGFRIDPEPEASDAAAVDPEALDAAPGAVTAASRQ